MTGRALRQGVWRLLLATLLVFVAAMPAPASGAQRMIVNALEYPWSAVGRVNLGGRGHCTGFLVSERHVLTAAHCLYDPAQARWRAPTELHFIAGYQREQYILHSKVIGFERAGLAAADGPPSGRNAGVDWAILTLERALGRLAGWIGLHPMTLDTLHRIKTGEAFLLQAGYRQDRQHVMTASLRCDLAGYLGNSLAHSCDVTKGDSGSPLLLYLDGAFFAAGIHSLKLKNRGDAHAFALSHNIVRKVQRAERGHAKDAADWLVGRAPNDAGPASSQPIDTIDALLHRLGYLRGGAAVATIDRQAAIAAFEKRQGLAITGRPSLALLGQLIAAGAVR